MRPSGTSPSTRSRKSGTCGGWSEMYSLISFTERSRGGGDASQCQLAQGRLIAFAEQFEDVGALREIMMGELEDLNTKTHVLRVVGMTADVVSYMDNSYSLLQTYYVHAFNETQGDVR